VGEDLCRAAMVACARFASPPALQRHVSSGQDARTARPDGSISGNRGAFCLCRMEGNIAHIEMLTFWEDVDAIKRFAGEDFEFAKYYDFDRAFLVELEPKVLHYTVYND
jgi:hypothetical protein